MDHNTGFYSELPGAVIKTDTQGRIVNCSASLVSYLNYKSIEELKGLELKSIFEGKKFPEISKGLSYFHQGTEFIITTINCLNREEHLVATDFFIPRTKEKWWKGRDIFILTGSPFSSFTLSKEIVYSIFKKAREEKQFDRFLNFIFEKLSKIIDTTNFYIALYDDKTDRYSFPIYQDEFDPFQSWESLEMVNSLTDFVCKSRKPLIMDDTTRGKFIKREGLLPQGTKSLQWLGVPLLNGDGKSSGVMAVQSYRNSDTYSQEDLKLMEFIAGNIGVSIDKIRFEEEQKRLQLIVEQSENLIATITPEGELTYINAAGKRLSGFDHTERKGENFFDNFLSRSEQDVIFAELSTKGIWKGRLTIQNRKNHRKFDVSTIISAIKESSAIYPHYSIIMKDLSDSIENEKKRRSLEEQLFHARKMEAVGTLAGGIAHDFNNILGAIIGFAELGMENSGNNRTSTYLEKIIKASERARDMTKQILAFSRKTRIKHQEIQLEHIIKETIRLLKNTLPANIRFRSRISKPLSPIKGDSAQMVQVIMNICTNSAYSMKKKGGIISINVKEPGYIKGETRYIEMIIKDSGTGMDPKTISRVFEPYFTTKPLGEGTGMGLSVVHGIIINHEGQIYIDSTPGKGTEVKILLPKILACSPEQAGKVKKDIETDNQAHILIIEDEEFLLEIVKQHLEKAGHKVTGFTSGREGLSYYIEKRRTIDLILTDQTLPDSSGTEIVEEVNKITPHLPSIITTGYNPIINETNYSEFGASHFLMKPFNKKELLEIIDLALKKI